MRFGICCGIDDAPSMREIGFDYVELPATDLIAKKDAYRLAAPETTNVFFPGSLNLYADQAAVIEYATPLIASAAEVGVKLMVIGSGRSRTALEGMSVEKATAQFVRLVAKLNTIASNHGINLAPESLHRGETNVGNDLAMLAQELRDVGVGYTADSYHVITEWNFNGNEGPTPFKHYQDQIPYLPAHVHVGGKDRLDPSDDDQEIIAFAHRLRELGYDGRVSLECGRRTGQSLTDTLRNFRTLMTTPT
ncbi:hypothetical protein BH11ARM1_BH11ARM1_01950 [soil metagenome]